MRNPSNVCSNTRRQHQATCVAASALALAVSAFQSQAQPYPTKPIRYIVPFGAGAAPDTVARILADRLTRMWNQQVIVENRVGVAGTLGAGSVAKSPPDG